MNWVHVSPQQTVPHEEALIGGCSCGMLSYVHERPHISMATILFRHFDHSKTILTAAMYRQYCLVMYQMCGNQTCKDWGWTERDEAS